MPESPNASACGDRRQVAPRSSGLPSANSAARAKNRALLDPYHNIASTFFSVGKTSDLDEAFLIAARDGEYDKIEALLQRRNDVLVSVDVRDKHSGNTPIIWAAKRGHVKIVQLLLRHGADITLRNYEGQTAVELASPQIRQLLLDAIDRGGSHRNLLQAAWQGNAAHLRKILSDTRSVDINCRNGDGLTPLLLVTRDQQLFEKLDCHIKDYNPADVVFNLLEHRGDPNAVDSEGRTPLHYASSTKATNARDVVKLLIEEGSAIDARDRRSFTPIHCASQSGNVDVVAALLEGGCDPNIRGYAGATPLHISAINGHNGVASELLQHGADVTMVDDSGLTAVDVAKTKKVKATLKQAWTEATQSKISERDLGPLRPPSREGLRMSWESKPSNKGSKRGGQVIFDHEEKESSRFLPPPSKSGEKSLRSARGASSILARGTYPPPGSRHTETAVPACISEIKLSLPTVAGQGPELVSPRKMSNPERPPLMEEQLLTELTEIRATPVPPTARSSKSISPRSAAMKRLNPLTPSHGGKRELKFGPGTKNHDGNYSRMGSMGVERHNILHKSASEPARLLPVTILGLELDEDQKARVKRVGSGKSHHRSHSDSRPYSPAPSATDTVSTIYDEVYSRGRSGSRASIITISDELDDYPYLGNSSRLNRIRTPSATDRSRLRIPHTIREGPSFSKKPVYDIDQGSVSQFPTAKRVLPPTPSSRQRPGQTDHSDLLLTDLSQDFSSKESSPRSDEDSDSEEDSDEDSCGSEDEEEDDSSGSDSDDDSGEEEEEEDSSDSSEEEFPLSYAEPENLTRSKSILKDGTFNIEATRVRRSDDSGCPEDRTSGSNHSSMRSSSGSSLSGDQGEPAGNNSEVSQQKSPENNNQKGTLNKNTGKTTVADSSKPCSVFSRNQSALDIQASKEEMSTKLHNIAKQNAVVAQQIAENASKLSQTLRQHRPASGVKSNKSTSQTGVNRQSESTDSKQYPKKNPVANINKPASTSVKQDTSKGSVSRISAVKSQSKRDSSPSTSVDETKNASKLQSSPVRTRPSSGRPTPVKSTTTTTKPLPSKPGQGQNQLQSAKADCDKVTAQIETKLSSQIPSMCNSAGQKTQTATSVNTNAQDTSVPCAKISSDESGGKDNSEVHVVSASQSTEKLPVSQVSNNKSPEKNKNSCVNPTIKSISSQKSTSPSSSTTTMVVSLRKPGTTVTPCKPVLKVGKPGCLSRGSTVVSRPASAKHQLSKGVGNNKNQSSAIKSIAISGQAKKPNITTSQERPVPVVTHTVQINVSPADSSKQQDESEISPLLNADTKPSTSVTSSVGASMYSSREGLTPVSSSTMHGGTKISVTVPSVDIQTKTQNQNKACLSEHKGPVISDPFEVIRAQQSKSCVPENKGRVRSAKKNRVNPNQRRGAGNESKEGRQQSGGKKRSSAKTKERSGENDKAPRPRSGKKVKGKKRKKSANKDRNTGLPKDGISGINGWKNATECNENTAVQSIRISQDKFSDSEEDTIRARDVPNYQGDFDMAQVRPKSGKSSRTKKSKRRPRGPRGGGSDGVTDGFTDENDTDSDILGLSEGEERSQGQGHKMQKPLGSDMEKIWEAEMKARAASPTNNMPTLVPQTVKAIDKFARSVNKADLHSMVGSSQGSASNSSKAPARPPPPKKVSSINAMVTSTTDSHSLKKSPQRPPVPPKPEGIAPRSSSKPAVPPRPDLSAKSNGKINSSNMGNSKVSGELPVVNSLEKHGPIEYEDVFDEVNSINNVTKPAVPLMRSTSCSNIPDAHIPQYDTKITDLAAPGPAENVDKVELESDVKTFSKTKAPRSKMREEAEIDSMIDEILKTTPAGTMSLSSLKSSSSTLGPKSGLTTQEARSRLETGLRKSMDGRMFCEVPVAQNNRETFRYHVSRSLDDLSPVNQEHVQQVGRTKLENLHRDFNIDEKDQEQLENLMKSLKRMELNINIEDIYPEVKGSGPGSSSRPPLHPKASVSPKISDASRPLQPGGRVDNNRNEKSPRFVRQRGNSLTLDAGDDGVTPGVKIEVHNPTKEFDSINSDFLSDAFSITSSVGDHDSIVPKDGRVVTSRLGRRSAQGREGSAVTTSSSIDDTMEMIQWKRGNMLGKGAYGTVWCGLTNAGELIAVKQIELDVEDMDKAEAEYEKIQEEVELLKTLKHKNIVGYLGTSLEEHIVSIFMQFVPGGSIANILARFGALEEEVFAHYTAQIVEGVAYLHDNNVIHRDIKGGNIMLMQNGVIKLIDFGCAKRLCINMNVLNNSSNRLLKSMRGTPYWMAPEVVKETGYGTKSDIWSIGCTVFEMATRKPPWADVPPMSAIFAIGSDKPVPQLPEKFSEDARGFVLQCLQRDQTARPSAKTLLLHPFLAKKRRK